MCPGNRLWIGVKRTRVREGARTSQFNQQGRLGAMPWWVAPSFGSRQPSSFGRVTCPYRATQEHNGTRLTRPVSRMVMGFEWLTSQAESRSASKLSTFVRAPASQDQGSDSPPLQIG